MIMTEDDIRIDFGGAVSARRFDDAGHGLSHCMKAVDFIVGLSDRILFVEIKDPQNPRARSEAVRHFISEFQSGRLVREKLTHKCRDSYLYELAMGHITKPVYFLVLIGLDTLTDADLLNESDRYSEKAHSCGRASGQPLALQVCSRMHDHESEDVEFLPASPLSGVEGERARFVIVSR